MGKLNLLNEKPETWEDLERLTELLFQRTGHRTQRKRVVDGARGKVEIDVFAIKPDIPMDLVIACECKYWKRKVSQSTVHSFRTVVADIGANVGYIITKNGQQSGAIKATDNTNIQLLTWEDLLDKFREQYLKMYVFPKIAEYCYDAESFFYSDFYDRLRKQIDPGYGWRVKGYWLLEATYRQVVMVYRDYYVEHIDIAPSEIIKNSASLRFSLPRPIGMKILERLFKLENYDDLLTAVKETTSEMNKEFPKLLAD